jgi:hypothetical protein
MPAPVAQAETLISSRSSRGFIRIDGAAQVRGLMRNVVNDFIKNQERI